MTSIIADNSYALVHVFDAQENEMDAPVDQITVGLNTVTRDLEVIALTWHSSVSQATKDAAVRFRIHADICT
tara:strand:- start:44963 stop:45178 length:216 start_codon:yes stop_codon:yes gene_type:complete